MNKTLLKKSSSIRKKAFFLSIVLPSTIILLMCGILFYKQFLVNYHFSQENLHSTSENISDSISLELQKSFELLRNLAVNPLTARVINEMGKVPTGLDNDDYLSLTEADELKELMSLSSSGTNAEMVYCASLNSTGILVSSDIQISNGFDVRNRDYYQGAIENPGKPFISQPRVGAQQSAEAKIVITAAQAVLDKKGNVVGVVALNFDFEIIKTILKDLMEENSVNIALFDSIGEYMLWVELPDEEYFYSPEEIDYLADLAIELAMDESPESLTRNQLEMDEYSFKGRTGKGVSLIQTMHIPNTRWAINVDIPISNIYSSVLSSILGPLILLLIVLLSAQIGVFILYSMLMIKPIMDLGKELESLSEADADLTVTIPVQTNDEIGKVADSFNLFINKLRSLMINVKKVIENTDRVNLNVGSSTEETSSSIEQIRANLDSIANQMGVLDSNVTDNVASIEEVSQNISSMDDQIINQSAMVEESTAAITQMIVSLENVNKVSQNKKATTMALSDLASKGMNTISETANNFNVVVSHINQIQEMVGTISNIAAQTNLLSMNAAIEAAHAGDSGKGFAVVAEEIRKLADSAGQSSKSITQLIKDITRSIMETDENVSSTSEAFKKIETEVRDTVDAFSEIEQSVSELNIGGKQILESSNQINEVTINIKSGSQEIKAGMKVMLDSSNSLKSVSEAVNLGMTESTAGAAEIVTSMQLMVKYTQQLSDIVGILKENFGLFRT
jgi:methyl-accepting chemotaxis protein